MGKLFDMDNFSLKDALLDPLVKPVEGTVSIAKNIGDGDFKGILGDNQDISTGALKNLGFNPDNKLVKNSDAIAGTIIGGIMAAPAITGALGGSASAAGSAAGGAAGSAAGGAAGGAAGSAAGGTAGSSGFFTPRKLIGQGIQQAGKALSQQQQVEKPQFISAPRSTLGRGQMGKKRSYKELMEMFNG